MSTSQGARPFLEKVSRVLVTGATGFVGRNVVRALVRKGFEVIALVRRPDKAAALPSLDGVCVVAFDLSDGELPRAVLGSNALIHCAWGDVRNHDSLSHIEEHLSNSYRLVKNALALGVSTVIVTGTSWEYGQIYGPVHASTTPRPNNAYGTSKHLLHLMLRRLQHHSDFRLIWARLFYVYGEGDDPRSLLALFDKALEAGEKIFNMSLGEQLYDFLPVEVGAEQLVSLLDAHDGVYNVCSGKPISLRRLLEEKMRAKNQHIELNLGIYPYRDQDTIALWGADGVANAEHGALGY